jgi:hypothetical protein
MPDDRQSRKLAEQTKVIVPRTLQNSSTRGSFAQTCAPLDDSNERIKVHNGSREASKQKLDAIVSRGFA